MLTSMMLIPLALTVTMLGLAGFVYAVGSLALGLWMLALATRLHASRTHLAARRMFLASIVYLSLILILLIVDRGPVHGGGFDRTAVAAPASVSPVAAEASDG
jgi:heme O synthase-like polyprenyltransferase